MTEVENIWGTLEAKAWSSGFSYADYEKFWSSDAPPKHKKLCVSAYLKLIEALDIDLEEYNKENP